MRQSNSDKLFSRALNFIPGGVNSPVRAFKGVGGNPRFFTRGQGSRIYDVDGNSYIDYVGSWGALIMGHSHPAVIAAVNEATKNGLSFGAPTELEVRFAEKLCNLIPSLEMVRMVNSGTEATMSAIRLARGYTGRDKLIKFNGCYHGHADSLLAGAGSGLLTLGIPDSPGIPAATVSDTIVLEYNDTEQLLQTFEQYGNDIACVIIEPIAGNMNFVPATESFLNLLRKLCDETSSILIFDEVMTGFRVALGGAQTLLSIKPDLTTLGKVIGGGMPVGAFGGCRKIMSHIAPCGEVYQAGTLSGNPITMAAGLKTLELLTAPNFFEQLSQKTEKLCHGLATVAAENKVPFYANSRGGMFGFFFTQEKIQTFKQAKAANQDYFKRFYHEMLARGIYFAPSAFEAGFVSAAHSEKDIEDSCIHADEVMRKLN